MEFEISDTMTLICPDITAVRNDDGCGVYCSCKKAFTLGVLLSPKAALAFVILPGALSSLK